MVCTRVLRLAAVPLLLAEEIRPTGWSDPHEKPGCAVWCDFASAEDHCERDPCRPCEFCLEYEFDKTTKACEPRDKGDLIVYACKTWCEPLTAVRNGSLLARCYDCSQRSEADAHNPCCIGIRIGGPLRLLRLHGLHLVQQREQEDKEAVDPAPIQTSPAILTSSTSTAGPTAGA